MSPKRQLQEPLQELRDYPGRLPVSVIVTTFNEEVNIAECLESVLWADEIVLVDSFSTDRTLEIASRYPVRVLQRQYFGSAAQKNWSLDHVANDWVLILDADERVTPPLAAEILRLLRQTPQFHGYYIRRENLMLGRVIRHSGWSTDKVIRLFRRDKGRYPNRRVHADLDIDGPVPTLKNPLTHYTYRSFEQYYGKFLNYSEWGAAQGLKEGRKAGFAEIAGRPLWRFLRTYILQCGFLDGIHGLTVCGLQACGVFFKYFRLWEFRQRQAMGEEIHLPAFDESSRTWRHPDDDETPNTASGG